MEQALVTIEFVGTTAVITLDRPRRRNALDAALVEALADAFSQAERKPGCTCIVLTGAGSAFCAGAVLDTLLESAEGRFDSVIGVYEAFLRVLRSPLPVIGAVNGPAVGAGLNLALACDIRIASPGARFESRFPQLRLHPGGGHSWMLVRAVGRQQATAMALFGQPLSAEEALTSGLVLEVVDADQLRDRALELADALANLEREYVERVVDSLRSSEQQLTHAESLQMETERQRWSTTRADFVRHTAALRDRITSR